MFVYVFILIKITQIAEFNFEGAGFKPFSRLKKIHNLLKRRIYISFWMITIQSINADTHIYMINRPKTNSS